MNIASETVKMTPNEQQLHRPEPVRLDRRANGALPRERESWLSQQARILRAEEAPTKLSALAERSKAAST